MTVWIIIAVILLAAFGPIFWLRPSKRERMLARLRDAARKAGLVVEIIVLPKLDATPEERVSAGAKVRDPQITVAAYRLPLPVHAELAPSFCLLRNGDRAPSRLPGWVDHPTVPVRRKAQDADAYWGVVAEVVDGLSEDFVGVEANATNTCLYWKEFLRGRLIEEVIPDIAGRLKRLADLQLDIDEALRSEAEDDPSNDG